MCVTAVTRSVGIKVYGGEDKMKSIDKVAVSGLAGSTAGAVAGLARKNLSSHGSFFNMFILLTLYIQEAVLRDCYQQ